MKRYFIFVLFLSLITASIIIKVDAQSLVRKEVPYKATVALSPSGDINKPLTAISQISTFNQISNSEQSVRSVRNISIASAEVSSKTPMGMFKSMKVYLVNADGSNEVLIAFANGIPRYSENSLSLTLNKSESFESSTIKSDRINPNMSVSQSLPGQLTGVQAVPGGGLRIRGVSTTGNASPLYIIDGIERPGIDGLNPNDIESVEILKDAGQTAVYGMKGANGVVVVKTKNGDSDTIKKIGSMNDFTSGSIVYFRLEYVLRYSLQSPTNLNVDIGFVVNSTAAH